MRDVAPLFTDSADLWRELADAALPDNVQPLRELKQLQRTYRSVCDFDRNTLRAEIDRNFAAASESAEVAVAAEAIHGRMADLVIRIADLEERAFTQLREALG